MSTHSIYKEINKYAKIITRYIFITTLKLHCTCKLQSTLVISKSRGLSEILRDIRTSTYQICRIEKKVNRTTTRTFHNEYVTDS